MSDVTFSCTSCGQPISAEAKYVGCQVICPGCSVAVVVPATGPATPASPAPVAASSGGGGMSATAIALSILGTAVLVGGGVGAILALKKGDSDGEKPDIPNEVAVSPRVNSTPSPAVGSTSKPSGGFALNSSNPWPQFRGPKRDNKSSETGLLKQWPSNGPKLLWKATGFGKGYSSVAVAGGLVITMGDSGGGSLVHAVEEATGERVWASSRVGDKGGNYDGTKSTPAIDLANRRVFALGQFGDLVCLNLENGEEIWRQSLTSDLGGKFSQWNYAESPLLDGDRLIVTPGGRQGAVAALNATDGSTVWRSRQFTDGAQYVSAIPSPLPGRKHYIQLTDRTLVGLDAENGNLVWRIPRSGKTAVIPTPVVYNNIVFVTSGYGVGSHAFQINSAGGRLTTRRLYETKDLINHHGGIVLVDKYVYGHSDRRDWKCIDITNGREMWQNRGVGKGSLTYADGHLITRSEKGSGTVALIEATPGGYREKGRFNPPDRSRQNSWAHPVVANGKLFLRDQDVLLCYDLKG